MSRELLNQCRSWLEIRLSPLKVLVTVSILFSGTLGIFCITTLVYPPIEGNVMISIASLLMMGSAFVICMTHLTVIKWPKKRYTRFNKIIGCLLLISGIAYFFGNIYAIWSDCNYPLCELKMVQFILLPTCISITVSMDQLKCCFSNHDQCRETWMTCRYFGYSFIFLMEGIFNMAELITLQIKFGITYDILYIAMTSIINGFLGLGSLCMIITFLVLMVTSEGTRRIGGILLRVCVWIIVISAIVLMIWDIYLLYKMDFAYQIAWLVHYILVFVIAVLFGFHDTACCVYIGQYEVIPDSTTSREDERKQEDAIQVPS